MTLATAALVATEHEHAQTRRAAFLYLAHLPRRHRLPRRRLLPPRLGRAVARVRRHARAARGGPALPRRRVPAVPRRLRRQGRDDPPPRLAPRGAPRGAEPDLRADVGGPDQDRDLRDLPRVRGRPGRAAARVGRPRPRRGRRLDGAGGPLRADAARPQAAARLPQHREHRHHPRRRRGRDDLAVDRTARAGGARPGGVAPPRPEPRPLQGAALPRRGRGRGRDRDPPDRAHGRPRPPDALDGRASSSWAPWPSPACPS